MRVVSSVDKKLEVKQRFLEIFQEDNYPSEFAYKSKVCVDSNILSRGDKMGRSTGLNVLLLSIGRNVLARVLG